VEPRQDLLVLDQNQVLRRRRVGDDNHSTNCLAVGTVSEFRRSLLTQTRTGLALALEVLDRVVARHAATLENERKSLREGIP
jgi:hypothetical protein